MGTGKRKLEVVIVGDANQAVRALRDLESAASKVDRSTQTTAQRFQQTGETLTRTLTPAAIAAGAAFGAAFSDFDRGADALRAGTGATGVELERLTDSMRRVGAQVPQSLGQIGEVMADVAQRTGLTGPPLEQLTKQLLDLERMGNAASTETVTRVFGDWGIAAEDSSAALDELFRVSQLTGPFVDRIGQLMVQYGAPLREFGLGFDEAAVLMGKFEQEGVNTELAMGGLRRALGRFADEGRDPAQALEETFDAINSAGSAAEANAIAFDVFGARAGVDLARAIEEGRFSLDDMMATLEGSTETVSSAADDTLDLSDRLAMLKNQAVGVIGPFGELGMGLSGLAAISGPVIQGIGRLGQAMQASQTVQYAAGVMRASTALRGLTIATGVIGGLVLLAQTFKEVGSSAVDYSQLVERAFEATTGELVQAFKDLQAMDAPGFDGTAESLKMFEELARDNIGTAQDLRNALAGEGQEVSALDEILTATTEGQQRAAERQQAHQEAVEGTTDAVTGQTTALQELLDVTNELISSGLDYEQSVIRSADAVDRYRTAAADGTVSARDLQQAELDAAEAILSQAEKAVGSQAALQGLTVEELGAAEAARIQIGELQRVAGTLDPGSPLRQRLEGYISRLRNGVPGSVTTTANVSIGQALERLAYLQSRMQQLQQLGVHIPTSLQTALSIGRHHSGGLVRGVSGSEVPILAQAGEFVIDAATTSAIRRGTATAGGRQSAQTGGTQTVVVRLGEVDLATLVVRGQVLAAKRGVRAR